MDGDCPCGSGATYAECCGPLHGGQAQASTAEQLMRSRYSAFVVQDAAYLTETWDPATRPARIEFQPGIEWRRLQIRAVSGGGEDDQTGTVEFVAHCWDAQEREYGRQHETSRFARRKGCWVYVDAAS